IKMPTSLEDLPVNQNLTPSDLESHHLDASGEAIQLVSFQLAREEYGIEITKVQEIILLGDITRVPQTADYIVGLINLRSTVIPIIDLRLRFQLENSPPTDDTRIIVVNVAGK